MVIEAGPFYLEGLLFCHVPMRPVTWRRDRAYQCGACRWSIDALTAEVEVWELATRARPRLGDGSTPYAKRRALLASMLDRVRSLDIGRYELLWQQGVATEPGWGRTGR
jgi:hypothetical protein